MESPIPMWLSARELSKYPGPPVGQITTAVVDAINRSDALSGDRLPPVRKLADHLGIAVNTVAKAYKRLEEWKLVEGRGRAGTVVSTDSGEVRNNVQRMAAGLVKLARRSGVSISDLHDMLDTAAGRQEQVASNPGGQLVSNTRSTKLAS